MVGRACHSMTAQRRRTNCCSARLATSKTTSHRHTVTLHHSPAASTPLLLQPYVASLSAPSLSLQVLEADVQTESEAAATRQVAAQKRQDLHAEPNQLIFRNGTIAVLVQQL